MAPNTRSPTPKLWRGPARDVDVGSPVFQPRHRAGPAARRRPGGSELPGCTCGMGGGVRELSWRRHGTPRRRWHSRPAAMSNTPLALHWPLRGTFPDLHLLPMTWNSVSPEVRPPDSRKCPVSRASFRHRGAEDPQTVWCNCMSPCRDRAGGKRPQLQASISGACTRPTCAGRRCWPATVCGSGRRVSEDLEPSWHRGHVSHRRGTGTPAIGQSVRSVGENTIRGAAAYQDFLALVEGRRPRHPDPQAGPAKYARLP